MTDLSPAQAIMVAATNGNFNLVNDPVYKQCIAAALRAAADQVLPGSPAMIPSLLMVRYRRLAIATEIEA